MVQVNSNFGNSNVNGLGGAKRAQQSKDDDLKPETIIDGLKIYRNGTKVYDDGKKDKIYYINIYDDGLYSMLVEDDK